MFKKDKEYLIYINNDPKKYRVICNKIIKDTKGTVVEIHFTIYKELLKLKPEQIVSVIQPIENVEFFSMYINWYNFYKEGPHQDLEYAEKVHQTILNSLSEKSFVQKGTGAFVAFDYTRLDKLFSAIKSKPLHILHPEFSKVLNENTLDLF